DDPVQDGHGRATLGAHSSASHDAPILDFRSDPLARRGRSFAGAAPRARDPTRHPAHQRHSPRVGRRPAGLDGASGPQLLAALDGVHDSRAARAGDGHAHRPRADRPAQHQRRRPAEVLTPAARDRLSRVLGSDATTTVVSADESGPGRATAGGDRLVWHFVADTVNDFAWATAKQFVWQATRATIPGRGAIPVNWY